MILGQRTSQTDLDQTDVKRSSVLSATTLNYTKVIGKHDISAVVGIEFQNYYINGTLCKVQMYRMAIFINYNLFDPADITVTERDETSNRESVFGRINYAYDNRYLVSVSVRRDGDSRFGANKKYAIFPAFL